MINEKPTFSRTPKVSWGTITTANTAKDGTGTVVPIFTAGADGSYVDKIIARAMGTNTATVLRVWLNNGGSNAVAANNTMIAEATISSTTNSEVAKLADFEIPINARIPAGYVINVTIGTTVAAGIHVSAWGADLTA